MPYTPPVGAVALHLAGSYTPPVGVVALLLGGSSEDDRAIAIVARSPSARGVVRLSTPIGVAIVARSAGSRGVARTAYDPNLLSDTVAAVASGWRQGARLESAFRAAIRPAPRLEHVAASGWRPAAPIRQGVPVAWRVAPRMASQDGRSRWREADARRSSTASAWRGAPGLRQGATSAWRDGARASASITSVWVGLPLVTVAHRSRWRDADQASAALVLRWAGGAALGAPFVTRWRQAGYPGHWIRVRPPRPPLPRPSAPVRLCLGWPLPGTALHLGRGCRAAPIRRWYYVFNSASLVRLPDRLPLPCTSLTIRTDADSWAWSLSATLFGADAYDLIAPQAPAYLPVEVEATVNGYMWQFLLDAPRHDRQFARATVALSGRSRSAWLSAPYTRATSGANASPTTAIQAAETAIENTGWAIDWQAVDWLIPAGVLSWAGTPIERVIQLARPIDACVLSDPVDDVLHVYPRYPAVPWEWSTLVADHVIPESVPRTLQRADDRRPLVNGVYLSGTTSGVLAACKVAGTDGALQADMVTDALLCDAEGVAARARAVSVLSQSGPGSQLTAETLLMPSTSLDPPRLVLPGEVVDLVGERTLARGVQIAASWTAGGLSVAQTLTLERREVEA